MTRGELHFGGNTVKVWLEIEDGEVRASSVRPKATVKFREFAGKYESECVPQMKPASQASIKSVLGILAESFGDRRLQDIGTEEIQKFVTGSPYAPKTVKNQVGVMRMAWNKARAWGYVKHNPFEFLSFPRAPLAEARTLSVDEVRAIIRKTDEPFKTMLWILAETGIRGGELCGLYRSDVDARTIRIARSAFRKQIQTPKTVNAVREIAISGRLAAHLSSFCGRPDRHGPDKLAKRLVEDALYYMSLESDRRNQNTGEQPDGEGDDVARIARAGIESCPQNSSFADALDTVLPVGKDHLMMPDKRSLSAGVGELIFSMPDGRPWDNGEIVRRLKPVLGTGFGLHALRHANASLMASLGVPEHIRRERLGHSSGNVTARYTHSSPDDHRRWAEEIGRACTENVLAMGMGAD